MNIKEIHDSNLYGVIIEAGCSATIASTLMNVAGSSKTIHRCEQPYSKEYQETLYGNFKRSVSREWIKSVLEIEATKSDKINFVLASSWQLMDPNDPLQYTHGWIGLFDIQRNVKHYLHFTFRRDFFTGYNALTDKYKEEYTNYKDQYDSRDRKDILDVIGKLAVGILHTAIDGDIEKLSFITSNGFFNEAKQVLDMAYINDDVNYHLLINTLEKVKKDYFLVFDKTGIIRIEDLMRKADSFIIQKGSFNPLHHAHVEIMNRSKQKYTEATPVFLVSTYRYDKPHINYDELKDRIKTITEAGYPFIICKSVLFYETFDLLKKWSYNKKLLFPVGTDTINRIIMTDKEHFETDKQQGEIGNYYVASLQYRINKIINSYKDNFKFLHFQREGYQKLLEANMYSPLIEDIDNYQDDGISSTKIRSGEIKNKI
jgi:hypothetical protein